MKKTRMNEPKKMVTGAVAAVCVCTLLFAGSTQAAKLAIFNHTEKVPTTYNTDSIIRSVNPDVPAGYVESNYKVNLVETGDTPAAKDMSMEKAAKLGAQNLWQLYSVSLNNQTVYMTYIPADDFQSRALWYGEVVIHDKIFYTFQVDAVTGENYSASRWDYSNEQVKPLEKLKDYQVFLSHAKTTAVKDHIVTGNVISSEYMGQRTMGKYLVIDIKVTSDTGEEAELTFETHSKDLVYVNYNSAVKQEEMNVEKAH